MKLEWVRNLLELFSWWSSCIGNHMFEYRVVVFPWLIVWFIRFNTVWTTGLSSRFTTLNLKSTQGGLRRKSLPPSCSESPILSSPKPCNTGLTSFVSEKFLLQVFHSHMNLVMLQLNWLFIHYIYWWFFYSFNSIQLVIMTKINTNTERWLYRPSRWWKNCNIGLLLIWWI